MNLQAFAYQINTTKKKESKLLQILLSIAFSLFIILAAVKLTLIFKPLYYLDVQYLNIEELSGFSKEDIIRNYNYVINYLLSPKPQEFILPSIPYSEYGQIHFRDVKKIFTYIDILLVIFGFFSIVGLFFNLKFRLYGFLKKTASMLIWLPAILFSAIILNFDTAFVIFHKIFFRNDYWQFDPDLDPIINILPQEFFYHSALLIIILIAFSVIALKLLYKSLNHKRVIY